MIESEELAELYKDIDMLLQSGEPGGAANAPLMQRLEQLVVSGAEIIGEDIFISGTITFVQWACITGRADHLKLCIELGGDVNAPTSDGHSPLHLALLGNTSKEAKESVKLLLDAGAHVGAVTRGQRTPLHYVAFVSDRGCTEMLIDKGADMRAQDKRGDTALHLAAQEGNVEVLTALVERGADINANAQTRPSSGRDGPETPLVFAIERKHDECAAILIEAGATCEERHLRDAIRTLNGTDSVTLACLVPMFPDYKPHWAMDAAKTGRLLSYGMNPNNMMMAISGWYNSRTTGTGRTAQRSALTRIVDAGYDMSTTDERGDTLLHKVLECSEVAVADLDVLLRANGVEDSLNAYNHQGYTPLHKYLNCRRDPSRSMVRKLLDHGADPTLTGGRLGRNYIKDVKKVVPGYVNVSGEEAAAQGDTAHSDGAPHP